MEAPEKKSVAGSKAGVDERKAPPLPPLAEILARFDRIGYPSS